MEGVTDAGVLGRAPRGSGRGAPWPSQVQECCDPGPVAGDRLSLCGREDGSARCGSGADSESSSPAAPGAAVPHHLISGGSRCSYLWIVPITSVKKGVQQADYWLPGVREGNPALSQQTAGPPQTPSSWPTFWGLQQDSGAASFVISFNKWS